MNYTDKINEITKKLRSGIEPTDEELREAILSARQYVPVDAEKTKRPKKTPVPAGQSILDQLF
jgi:hypothetical protein